MTTVFSNAVILELRNRRRGSCVSSVKRRVKKRDNVHFTGRNGKEQALLQAVHTGLIRLNNADWCSEEWSYWNPDGRVAWLFSSRANPADIRQ
jgi:hypothetical protein